MQLLGILLGFFRELINLTCCSSYGCGRCQCTIIEELSAGFSCITRPRAILQDCISCGEIACSNMQYCCLLGAHDPSFSPLFSLFFLKRINSPSSHFIWQNLGRYNFSLYVFVYLREASLSVFLKFKNSVLPLLWVWKLISDFLSKKNHELLQRVFLLWLCQYILTAASLSKYV